MTKASAATRAFDVAELREMILAQLPMKDILLNQRVSKDFRDTIQSSKLLQEALFFRTDKLCRVEDREWEEEKVWKAIAGIDVQELQHATKKYGLEHVIPPGGIPRPDLPKAPPLHTIPLNSLFLPPQLDHEKSSIRCRSIHPGVRAIWIRHPGSTSHYVDMRVVLAERASPDELTAALATPGASWRKMHVKHCPCSPTTVTLYIHTLQGANIVDTQEKFAAGVKMGEIMDWCASRFARYKSRPALEPPVEDDVSL
ncbi:hypothetical protein PRZ48_012459 [Zasmidium cellare]|uniref:F-box domain-containing protein n=1 Tax=Zasmidium cellare TaxID=395010 RepID=A0ABR0E4X9_ZASCE|nr:hypothetical protein PRZ48_012459 [Zasmidium cellare]